MLLLPDRSNKYSLTLQVRVPNVQNTDKTNRITYLLDNAVNALENQFSYTKRSVILRCLGVKNN